MIIFAAFDVPAGFNRPAQRKSPVTKTVRQQLMATTKRSPLTQAVIRPTTRAAAPDHMLFVAPMMAGKAMTARVTKGT